MFYFNWVVYDTVNINGIQSVTSNHIWIEDQSFKYNRNCNSLHSHTRKVANFSGKKIIYIIVNKNYLQF